MTEEQAEAILTVKREAKLMALTKKKAAARGDDSIDLGGLL